MSSRVNGISGCTELELSMSSHFAQCHTQIERYVNLVALICNLLTVSSQYVIPLSPSIDYDDCLEDEGRLSEPQCTQLYAHSSEQFLKMN